MPVEDDLRTGLKHIEALLGAQDRNLRDLLAAQDRRYEQSFLDLRTRLDSAQKASDMAVSKAEKALERRLEAVNEFRQMMETVVNTLMPRAEAAAAFTTVDDKLGDMKTRLDMTQGTRTGFRELWGWMLGAAGLAAALVAVISAVLQ